MDRWDAVPPGQGGNKINPLYWIPGVPLAVLGYTGFFVASLIRSAVCRQREYLADAAAVQYTRNPYGLTGALRKIGGLASGAEIRTKGCAETSHLFIGDAQGRRWLFRRLFATHPRLVQRIRALDPSFGGSFPELPEDFCVDEAGAVAVVESAGGLATDAVTRASPLAESIQPRSPSLTGAASLLSALPEPLRQATREPASSPQVVFALLVDGRDDVRSRQLALLRVHGNDAADGEDRSGDAVETWAAVLAPLGPEARLAVLDLCLPALRRLTAAQRAHVVERVRALIEADQRIELFEYVLGKVLDRRLGDTPSLFPRAHGGRGQLRTDGAVVLAALAYRRGGSTNDMRQAFDAAMSRMVPSHVHATLPDRTTPLDMPSPAQCKASAFDASLTRLEGLPPALKQRLLQACYICIERQGVVEPNAASLMRVVTEMLGCARAER